MDLQELRNFLIAVFLSFLVMFVWFYDGSRVSKSDSVVTANMDKSTHEDMEKESQDHFEDKVGERVVYESRDEGIKSSTRVGFKNGSVQGSIALRGGRLDDLVLLRYKDEMESEGSVELLSPEGVDGAYFIEFGWLSADSKIAVPTSKTIWTTDKSVLTDDYENVRLSWVSPQNIEFILIFSLDANYMFDVEQRVVNRSGHEVKLIPYGRVARAYDMATNRSQMILHEGAVVASDNKLHEYKYGNLLKKRSIKHKLVHNMNNTGRGWFGFSDKYWFSAIIPSDRLNANVQLRAEKLANNKMKMQADYVGKSVVLGNGDSSSFSNNVFAGAKELSLLDSYMESRKIQLFDCAVDFGWLYFITRPLFLILQYINKICNNFGMAIILLTVIVKMLMFPLAKKSHQSVAAMKSLQPEIKRLQEECKDNRVMLNQKMITLFKENKVNPVLGFLPLLIQIPVFFALYKVLYVTIEMRHAPFIWWVKDLSAPDPVNVFDIFHLVGVVPSAVLSIGVWPVLLGVVMVLQQKFAPMVPDQEQALAMKLMPYVLVVMFATLPVGLIIYWTWSNVLSIVQQMILARSTQNTPVKSV